jgi:hypothetical protein
MSFLGEGLRPRGEVDRAMTHLMDRVAEARRRSEGGR